VTELILIRHGQASFGAADYDVLSKLGHRQSVALGQALAATGCQPDAVFMGGQRRHRETLEGLAQGLALDPGAAVIDEGLNEFAFGALLDARHGKGIRPEGMGKDRAAHFRELRDCVLCWQRDELSGVPERFAQFTDRVVAAHDAMARAGKTVLAVSSGGAISRLVAHVMQAPPAQMIQLQLQMKNSAVTRLRIGRGGTVLQTFNETPHIGPHSADLLSYS